MEHIFITGTNRGIGLELVSQYAKRENTKVFAACRQPEAASDLQQIALLHSDQVVVLPLEVTDGEAIRRAVEVVRQQTDTLDVLFNNAGIDLPGRDQAFETINPEAMRKVYEVNTIAPLMMAQAFIELLKKSSRPRLINVTSQMGSITQRDYGGSYAYCASKAALDMTTRGLAADLRSSHVICIALDPGWVKTDMGGGGAALKPEESVSGILTVVDQLSEADNGNFLQWNGNTLPW